MFVGKDSTVYQLALLDILAQIDLRFNSNYFHLNIISKLLIIKMQKASYMFVITIYCYCYHRTQSSL